MLDEKFIKINDKSYTPSTWDYSYDPVESVSQSEAGNDLVITTKLDRHVFNASWNGITYELMSELESYCLQDTVKLTVQKSANMFETYNVRARGIAPAMLPKSYKYRRSNGLWNISITFTEV